MASEISETPTVFRKILENQDVFVNLQNLLNKQMITSVLILARGTSDNAAHFLKYLIACWIDLTLLGDDIRL